MVWVMKPISIAKQPRSFNSKWNFSPILSVRKRASLGLWSIKNNQTYIFPDWKVKIQCRSMQHQRSDESLLHGCILQDKIPSSLSFKNTTHFTISIHDISLIPSILGQNIMSKLHINSIFEFFSKNPWVLLTSQKQPVVQDALFLTNCLSVHTFMCPSRSHSCLHLFGPTARKSEDIHF